MESTPLRPPAPFPDFDFSFDPNIFPNPPPLPSSADLFSPDETMNLFGFLDNFGELDWELTSGLVYPDFTHSSNPSAPYSNPHLNTSPEPSTSSQPTSIKRTRSTRSRVKAPQEQPVKGQIRKTAPNPSSPTSITGSDQSTPTASKHRARPLLSTPQKRLNHIMSEQKRRNAIRDGYAQLIALIAPAGTANSIGMPTRGRPRGSGGRGNSGQTKGKSGVLFRAVEYCRWLEEGTDALRDEVLRLEAAGAAIRCR